MKEYMFALLLFLISPVYANEQLTIRGAGAVSCGKYLEGQKNAVLTETSWVQGFLSGMNVADAVIGKQMISLPDLESINLYMINYCKENPLENAYLGSMNLYIELRARRNP